MDLREVKRVCREMRKLAERQRREGDAAVDLTDTAPEMFTVADPYLAFYIAWGLHTLGLPGPERPNEPL